LIRRKSLETLREMGINPYPAEMFPVNVRTKEIKDNFNEGEEKLPGSCNCRPFAKSQDNGEGFFCRDPG
jgi:hypothetical protein